MTYHGLGYGFKSCLFHKVSSGQEISEESDMWSLDKRVTALNLCNRGICTPLWGPRTIHFLQLHNGWKVLGKMPYWSYFKYGYYDQPFNSTVNLFRNMLCVLDLKGLEFWFNSSGEMMTLKNILKFCPDIQWAYLKKQRLAEGRRL